jgi:hypothetical protein
MINKNHGTSILTTQTRSSKRVGSSGSTDWNRIHCVLFHDQQLLGYGTRDYRIAGIPICT